MRRISRDEQQTLHRLFEGLEEHDIAFVVLRKYERLPRYSPSDIDILVDPDEFEQAVELSETVGFRPEENEAEPEQSSPSLRSAIDYARAAGGALVDSPGSLLRSLSPTRGRGDDTLVRHRRYEGLELDMVNHLRFPERGGEPVPSRVEELLLERRKRYKKWYVPSPPDELAHVIAHCVADYDRAFPEYYADKYDSLRETVLSNRQYRTQFGELLEYLFDDDAAAVFNTVATDEYSSITEPLSLRANSRPKRRALVGFPSK